MERILRNSLSALAVIGFFMMAVASLGPDESTYLNVAIDSCPTASETFLSPDLYITVLDDELKPVTAAGVNVFVTYQKVISTIDCDVESIYESHIQFTDAAGKAEFHIPGMHMDNRGDLIRVEMHIWATSKYVGYWELYVFPYGGTDYYNQVFYLTSNDKL